VASPAPGPPAANRVTVPKGTVAETPVMKHDPRPHIDRRGHAIGRLRSLTAGAAIAGLAGTAGFGVVAAASWSGDATGTNDGTTTQGTNGSSGTNGSGPSRPQATPRTGGSAQQPTVTTPEVRRGSGSGHASSGGSH
jgi:hypothetical protein